MEDVEYFISTSPIEIGLKVFFLVREKVFMSANEVSESIDRTFEYRLDFC
jgi:hypothetical protein